MNRPRFSLFAVFLGVSFGLCMLTSCSSEGVIPVAPAAAKIWVVSWGNSPENGGASVEDPGGTEQSFRSFFYPTVSGTVERVHFSNYFGTVPLTIGAARLAVAAAVPAIDPTRDAGLTFNGSSSVTIAPGQAVVSDPVSLPSTLGQKMAVTMYLPGTFGPLTQHDSQVITNYASAQHAGNTTGDASGATFSTANTVWLLLTGMDVYGAYGGTVVLFGSSSIDGHASNYGNTNAYPIGNTPIATQDDDRPSDWLGRQLNAAGYNLGVLNAGVLGDPAGPISIGSAGVPGIDRMERDVLSQPSVKAVVIYLGAVDLRGGACGDAAGVEGSLMNMVAQAQAAGVRVILGTVPPATFCTAVGVANSGPTPTGANPFAGDLNPGPENPDNAQRRILNTWIKTTGAQLPGVAGIADFDAALADPAHPDFLLPSLNSGDNFHPNGVGYGIQSAAIPLGSLLAP